MALRDLKPQDDDLNRPASGEKRFGILGDFDRSVLYLPQGPDTGINAMIGKWPGDETDEEIAAILEELS
jgi:hypothetical protein